MIGNAGICWGNPARQGTVESLNPWWLTLGAPVLLFLGGVLKTLVDRWQHRDTLAMEREKVASDLTLEREAKASEISLSRDSIAFNVLQQEMTRMAGRLETLEGRIAHLERELDASHLKVTELQGELYRTTTERDSLARENAKLTETVGEQNSRLLELEGKIALEKAAALVAGQELARLREKRHNGDDPVLGHQPREIVPD